MPLPFAVFDFGLEAAELVPLYWMNFGHFVVALNTDGNDVGLE